MHAQLRDTAVDGSDTRSGAQHRTNSAARSRVVPDLEDLQFGADFVCAALHDGRRDRVCGHVAVGVGRDDDANVEAWRVVFEVGVEEVGVDGVDDVRGDEEGVGVGLADDAGAGDVVVERGDGALDDRGQEVASGALAEERADFFVVE